jgi:hypothetical protein
MQVKNIDARMTLGGECELLLTLPKSESKSVENLLEEFSQKKDKVWEAAIAIKRKKRSLNANAALWKMLSMMADKLNTTKDELYLEMLDRYGVFTHVVVKPNVVHRVKQEWKTVRELGEVVVNGQKGIQLQCYFGSSTYDSKEFSVLLDGVIQEAKEIGIDFISREEQARMIAEWGNSDGKV